VRALVVQRIAPAPVPPFDHRTRRSLTWIKRAARYSLWFDPDTIQRIRETFVAFSGSAGWLVARMFNLVYPGAIAVFERGTFSADLPS
jgi:hypothetical protein